jgi:hypothetical protein
MVDKTQAYSTHGKKETASSQGKAASPDKLTKTDKKGDVELTEDDLDGVCGGKGHAPNQQEFLTIKLTPVLVSSYGG